MNQAVEKKKSLLRKQDKNPNRSKAAMLQTNRETCKREQHKV